MLLPYATCAAVVCSRVNFFPDNTLVRRTEAWHEFSGVLRWGTFVVFLDGKSTGFKTGEANCRSRESFTCRMSSYTMHGSCSFIFYPWRCHGITKLLQHERTHDADLAGERVV